MSSVNALLKMFDELDAYEATELMEELASRGYELKINRALEKKKIKKNNCYGLFLEDYDEKYKIATIKEVRNMAELYDEYILGGMRNMSLQSAKEFVEDKKHWDYPVLFGNKEEMLKVYNKIKFEFSNNEMTFELYEINPEEFSLLSLYDNSVEGKRLENKTFSHRISIGKPK